MTRDVFDAFADAVKHSDDVMECHMVKGGFVYVKARAAGMETHRQFLSEVILPLPACGNPH
ncbi:Lrp/AsnC ligand binding domain-containing protein [Rhizobium mongolense]|uniref:Lrp/AsnC ligand binding domain-containing protein n=1 Tax=Rhizobium TaxID=379 RepID=UPI0032C22753